jgi:cell wall-associated NlpC family hydrolase
LMGQWVTEYERREGTSFVQSHKDGFVGYVDADFLGPATEATHKVSARATHAYAQADLKSQQISTLSLGAQLTVRAHKNGFSDIEVGWVPSVHLIPIAQSEVDPVAVAERLLGTPYLWGGNSFMGIDCSGLVQAALLAAGIACPGDSDQQEVALGVPVSADEPFRRGDLIFWKGHVAMVVDEHRLIHANAHKMAVTYEGIEDAITRIAATDGPVMSRRRVM